MKNKTKDIVKHQIIINKWKEGLTYKEIGTFCNISKQRVEQILKVNGFKGRNWLAQSKIQKGIMETKRLKKYGKKERLSKTEKKFQYQLGRVKARAKKEGIEYNLKVKDFFPLPTHCPIFNLRLNYFAKKIEGDRDNWVSIDRIDPNKGYTPENTHIISYKANRCKNNMTLPEVKRLYEYLDKLYKLELQKP